MYVTHLTLDWNLIFGLGTTILSEHMKSNYDLIDETVVMQFTTMQEGSLPF